MREQAQNAVPTLLVRRLHGDPTTSYNMTDQQTPEKVELLESLTVLEVEEKREMFTLAGDEEVRLYRGVRFFTPGLQIYGSTGGFFER